MSSLNPKYPSVFHIGLPKTGTTTIQHILGQDQRVNLMMVRNYNTVDWFNKEFDLCKPDKVNVLSEENILLHMNIDGHGYVKSSIMLERMAQTQPNAQIILTIREPKKLLCSRYKYHIPYWEGYSKDFEDWLGTQQGADYCSICCYRNMYKQILTYFPKEQIHFILFEDLIHDKEAYIKKYYEIIGLNLLPEIDLNTHQNENLTEPEIKAIKKLNRFKVFKKGGKLSQMEANLYRKLVKRKRDKSKKVEDFKWQKTRLFKGWEKEFYDQNKFLVEEGLVDAHKMKKYGYLE